LKGGEWYERPYYHLFYLFTHTTQPGWWTVKVDGPRNDVFVAAMTSLAKDFTLYATNRSAKGKTITVGGLGGRLPYAWVWNAAGAGTLSAWKPVETNEHGKATIDLPPMSVMAASNVDHRGLPGSFPNSQP
jgi:hypothetical protein